jgi:xanthine/uracil permease
MQFLAGAAGYIDARSLAGVVLLVVVVYHTLPTRMRRRAVIVFAFAIAFAFARKAARVQTPLRQCAPRSRAR